jgi:hypothetical protein
MDGSRIALSSIEASGRPAYRVAVLRVNGDTVFNRTYQYQPIPIPNAAMDSAVRTRSRIGPEAAAVLAKVKLPGAYPPLERVLLGRDETTWLEIYPLGEQRTYHELDARGNPAGVITLPRNVRVMVASRDTIWATETDEDGLQHIVRYRVAR